MTRRAFEADASSWALTRRAAAVGVGPSGFAATTADFDSFFKRRASAEAAARRAV